MKQKKKRRAGLLIASAACVLLASGCGGGPERLADSAAVESGENVASEHPSSDEETVRASGAETSRDAVDSDTGAGNPAAQTGSPAQEKRAEEAKDSSAAANAGVPAETYDSSGSYAGTVAAEGVNEPASPYFGVMHARVLGVQTDEEEGTQLYNLQDLNDPENAWAIADTDIGSVSADMTPGSTVAALFHGDIVSDSENVRFIAILPDEDYEIRRAEGTTVNNVMSTFRLQLDGGSELSFLKDNCEIEEGAMQNDSGDRIIVYYAAGSDGTNYPFKIYGVQ